MPVFNYSDYADDLRNIICSNPIATNAVCSNSAIGTVECRSRDDMLSDITSTLAVQNILSGRNAVFGDLAVLRDRQFGPTASCTTCSNPVANAVSNNYAISESCRMTQEERIRAIAAFSEMDVDAVREDLADTIRRRNAGPGRQFRPRTCANVLSRVEEDYRKWELDYIKKLRSNKATIRYIVEVK
jgi:hypothetical protein